MGMYTPVRPGRTIALRSSSAVEAIEALAALGPAANKAKDSLQKIVDGSVPRRRTTSVRRTGSSRTASSALQEKLREKARQALEKVKIDAEQPEGDAAENRGDERGSKPIRTAPK